MTFEEDVTNWREISDFFLGLEINAEKDYLEGKLTEKEMRKLKNQIKQDWDYSMIINNPFLKANPKLNEIAKSLFKIGDLP